MMLIRKMRLELILKIETPGVICRRGISLKHERYPASCWIKYILDRRPAYFCFSSICYYPSQNPAVMKLYVFFICSVGIPLIFTSPLVARGENGFDGSISDIFNPNMVPGATCIVPVPQGGNLRGTVSVPRDCTFLSVWSNSLEADRNARSNNLDFCMLSLSPLVQVGAPLSFDPSLIHVAHPDQGALQKQLQCCVSVPCLSSHNQRGSCINAGTKSCSSGNTIP